MVAAKAVDADIAAALRHKLVQPATTLSQKYRVLFSLRNIPGPAAGEAIVEGTGLKCSLQTPRSQLKQGQLLCAGLKDASALFRHEVAYCLGQRQDPAAIETLKTVLADSHEHSMYVTICWCPAVQSSFIKKQYVCRVRHEAGEALGAIGTATCLKELQQYVQDPCIEVLQPSLQHMCCPTVQLRHQTLQLSLCKVALHATSDLQLIQALTYNNIPQLPFVPAYAASMGQHSLARHRHCIATPSAM